MAVLLVAALVASLVMTYSRHALLAVDSSSANLASQQAQNAADSGFAWAKQSLRADAGSATRLDFGDGRSVSVSVANGAGQLRTVGVDATTEGTRQSVQATFEVYSVPGDELPALTAAAKTAVNASSPTIISGACSYSSTDLTGVYVLRTGTSLTLQDVVLDGTLVSEAALTGSTGGVTIFLRGGVQIRPGATLPGCVIVAPDATLAGDGSERVELYGAIVAHSVSLTGSGALHGDVASASSPVLGSGIDCPGAGRAPRAWPTALVTNASGVSRLAFTGVDVRAAEMSAIRGYTFPNRRGGVSSP
jgi:hypothetical protein